MAMIHYAAIDSALMPPLLMMLPLRYALMLPLLHAAAYAIFRLILLITLAYALRYFRVNAYYCYAIAPRDSVYAFADKMLAC